MTRFERYEANHDLGPTFTGVADGVGGLIVPDEAMARIHDGTVVFVDEIPYPFVLYKGKDYPVVKTKQGWTIGGKHAEEQHAKNLAARARS
jgi:hypothetical protein